MIHDRDATTGREAADTLTKEGLDVRFVELDVTRMETISAAAARIEADFGKLDVLVNNAGIADPAVFHDWIDGQGPSIVYAKGGFGLSAQPIELLQRHIELSKNLEEQRRADFPSTMQWDSNGPSIAVRPAFVTVWRRLTKPSASAAR